MHDVDVADVGVAEHHLVDVLGGDQVLELLGDDRDPLGAARPGRPGRCGRRYRIWVAVNATTVGGSPRKALLKLWKPGRRLP